MKRVEQVSSWGYWDTLDGKRLEADEIVNVEWPDGTVSVGLRVSVDGRTLCTREHITHSQAYVTVEHHGAQARVPLLGLLAERVDRARRLINRAGA